MCNNKKIFTFNVFTIYMGGFLLLFVSIFTIYIQFQEGEFDIISTLISIFLLINFYIGVFYAINKVEFRNDEIIIKKIFKIQFLSNIAISNFIIIKTSGIILLIIKLKPKGKFIGYYSFDIDIHEELINLFINKDIKYKIKTIKFWPF